MSRVRRWRRIFMVCYAIDGVWQTDGEWFAVKAHAKDQAASNHAASGWPSRVIALDVPAEVFPKGRGALEAPRWPTFRERERPRRRAS